MVNYGHESVSRRCFVGCVGRKIQQLREWDAYTVLCEGLGMETEKLDDKNFRGSKQLHLLYKLCCRYMLAMLATPVCYCFRGKYVIAKEDVQGSWVVQTDRKNFLRIRALRFRIAIGTS